MPHPEQNSSDAEKVLKSINKELDTFSGLVSSGIRILALGIIGALWAIITANDVEIGNKVLFFESEILLRIAFASAGATLFFDLLQYIFALFANVEMDKCARSKIRDSKFNELKALSFKRDCIGWKGATLNRASQGFWIVKVFSSLSAAIALVIFSFAITL